MVCGKFFILPVGIYKEFYQSMKSKNCKLLDELKSSDSLFHFELLQICFQYFESSYIDIKVKKLISNINITAEKIIHCDAMTG